jgi:hypothetical protein
MLIAGNPRPAASLQFVPAVEAGTAAGAWS